MWKRWVVIIKNRMNKRELIWILLFIILLFSYILLFYRVLSPKKTVCTLVVQTEKYRRENQISLYYKNKQMKKFLYKETFQTKDRDLLEIKRTELEKKEYKVRTLQEKVKGSKEEKSTQKYKDVLKDLLEAGYTCKQ